MIYTNRTSLSNFKSSSFLSIFLELENLSFILIVPFTNNYYLLISYMAPLNCRTIYTINNEREKKQGKQKSLIWLIKCSKVKVKSLSLTIRLLNSSSIYLHGSSAGNPWSYCSLHDRSRISIWIGVS